MSFLLSTPLEGTLLFALSAFLFGIGTPLLFIGKMFNRLSQSKNDGCFFTAFGLLCWILGIVNLLWWFL